MAEIAWAIPVLALAIVAAGWIAHRLRLPPALGYLAVGVAVTPAVGEQFDLPVELLQEASHWSVLVLLFFVGLELDLKRVQEIVGKTLGTTVLNILVPLASITGVALLAGWGLASSLALGIALSVSSTLFGERLSATPGFGNEPRKRMLGILLGEDVAAAALLGFLVLLGGGDGGFWGPAADVARLVFFLILATAGALLVVPRLLDWVARSHVHELVVLVTVAIVAGFGALGAWAGSAELGAFVAGITAAEAGSRFVVRNSMTGVRDLALVVFFLASGLSVDPVAAMGAFGLAAVAAVVFIVSKFVVNVPASLAAGMNLKDSLRVAIGLATLGEFTLILVATAEQHEIAAPGLRDTVVGAMLALLVVAPIMMQFVVQMAKLADKLPPRFVQGTSVLLRSWKPPRVDPSRPSRLRRHGRVLASNLLLLVTWIVVAVVAGPLVVARVPDWPLVAPVLVVGVAAAVAAPLLWGTYRAYRKLVVDFVGESRHNDPSAKLRGRVLDVIVAVTVAILVLPLALLLPSARWPVLVGGGFLAIIVITLLWRQLAGVQRTLQESVTRVLGENHRADLVLDTIIAEYAWGVRFAAVAVPLTSPMANRKLGEGRIHELTGATVAVLQRRGREVVSPGPDEVLHPGDTLVLMGDEHQIGRAEALVVAHGEALRLSAQSKAAQVVELRVEGGSAIVGQPLGDIDLRGKSGALVVGVWPQAAEHPAPYRPSLSLQPGDRLIVLGTALQVQRARLLAEGEGQEQVVGDE